MPAPLPWSYTALEDFNNCPRAYHAKYVLKSIKRTTTPELIWGREVHKHFEDRLSVGTQLPKELEHHEPFMRRLDDKPGVAFIEQKIGFDMKAQPCHFFAQDVWCRGAIDYKKVDADRGCADIVDHKTGKVHNKLDQLGLFALHTFAQHPQVNLINAKYYWTQTAQVTKKVWGRAEIPELWGLFTPKLKQYKLAFQSDCWTPKQSGLCKRHCDVLDCEFNGKTNGRRY